MAPDILLFVAFLCVLPPLHHNYFHPRNSVFVRVIRVVFLPNSSTPIWSGLLGLRHTVWQANGATFFIFPLRRRVSAWVISFMSAWSKNSPCQTRATRVTVRSSLRDFRNRGLAPSGWWGVICIRRNQPERTSVRFFTNYRNVIDGAFHAPYESLVAR